MSTVDPFAAPPPETNKNGLPKIRCHAHKKNGDPCPQWAMRGQRVCRVHGGASPQARRKAQDRLASLIEPAITVLAREMVNQSARSGERTRAAAEILDRGGAPKVTEVTAPMMESILIARLTSIRARNRGESPTLRALPSVADEEDLG